MKLGVALGIVVKDKNGLIGIVEDIDEQDNEFGVLFSDADEAAGVWWMKGNELEHVDDPNSKEKFLEWYKRFGTLFANDRRPEFEEVESLRVEFWS